MIQNYLYKQNLVTISYLNKNTMNIIISLCILVINIDYLQSYAYVGKYFTPFFNQKIILVSQSGLCNI